MLVDTVGVFSDIDIKGWSVQVFYRELNVLPYFNTHMVARLKSYCLAYLHMIHFEPSRLNMKIFARVLHLFFRSSPVHLENYPEYVSRTIGRARESWERHELPVSCG